MTPYYDHAGVTLWQGDCRDVLATLPPESVQCVVTSPPYFGLRDYSTAAWQGGDADCEHRVRENHKAEASTLTASTATANHAKEGSRDVCPRCGARRIDAQIGLEPTPDAYVAEMVLVFREVRRVLREDGTVWLNLGDSYANDGKWGGHTGGKHVAALHCSPIGRNKRYTGLKPKDLIGIPWRVAFALQADGWWLRSDIVWAKPNPMPESITDRPTRSHEYIFLLSKSSIYYYDADAIRTPLQPKTFTTFGIPHHAQGNDALGGVKSDNWGRTVAERRPKMKMPDGWDTGGGAHGSFHREGREKGKTVERDPKLKQDALGKQTYTGFNGRYDPDDLAGANKRDVWTVATAPYAEAHFATFPPKLIEPCILAGCPAGGVVLDPFMGSGTTGLVAIKHGRNFVGVELNKDYIKMAINRLSQPALPFVAAPASCDTTGIGKPDYLARSLPLAFETLETDGCDEQE